MNTGKYSKLESFIFADLIVTVIFAVLAYGTVEPWSLALFELNALLMAVLLAIRFVFDPQAGWGEWRLALPAVALLIWGTVQFVSFTGKSLSFDSGATKEATVKMLALITYFIAALHTFVNSGRRRKVVIILTVFGFAVSLFAIIQRLTYNGKMYWVRPVSDYIAPYGPYGNYNHFAGMVELILPLPFAYLLLAKVNLEQRLLWLFAVVMMAVAVVLSLSRGGILAMGIEFMALMFIAGFVRKRWAASNEHHAMVDNKLIVGGALSAIVLLALWIGYEPLTKRFGSVRRGSGEYSLQTRAEYWHGAWQLFKDHPVTGVGLGAFPTVYPKYGRSSAKNERLEQVHNDYLQLLTDAGLIGGLIGLWFLFELIRLARRQVQKLNQMRSHERALIIGGYVAIVGIAVHSFLDFNLQIAANALLFLIVLALTASTDCHSRPESAR